MLLTQSDEAQDSKQEGGKRVKYIKSLAVIPLEKKDIKFSNNIQ